MEDFKEPLTQKAATSPSLSDQHEIFDGLLTKLKPLLDGGRLDNLVDLLSLISDVVDLLDPAVVEKLSRLFEDATSVVWSVGNAVRMAKADVAAEEVPSSLYGLLMQMREPDTRRGMMLLLRTLNVVGRQI